MEGAFFCITTYLTALIALFIGSGALLYLNYLKLNFFQGLTIFCRRLINLWYSCVYTRTFALYLCVLTRTCTLIILCLGLIYPDTEPTRLPPLCFHIQCQVYIYVFIKNNIYTFYFIKHNNNKSSVQLSVLNFVLTEKSNRNLIRSNPNQIVFAMHRMI